MSIPVRVRFEPSGKVLEVAGGESLLTAAQRAGLHVNASCGGQGTCGSCKVRVREGRVEGGEHSKLSSDEISAGYRLACSAYPASDCTIEIPLASSVDHSAIERGRTGKGGRALSPSELKTLLPDLRIEPTVFKVAIRLDPPSRDDTLPDLDRLLLALRKSLSIHSIHADFETVRTLGQTLRAADWSVTATLVFLGDRYRLIQVEPGDTAEQNFAIIVDVGTTTLAAQLLDLRECAVVDCDNDECPDDCNTLANTSRYNPQISYGEDVISRILHARTTEGLDALQRVVVEGINEMIDRLLKRSGSPRERVSHVIVAGNSTMTHLLLGMDPKSIREAPYVTAVSSVPVVRARELGICLGPHVYVWTFPLVASWVGGDIVAGILGSGAWQRDETTLFIDVGTNGEIVLGNTDWMVTTSCSAGPAFEGGGVRCGMRAAKGAIEDVEIDPVTYEPRLTTIGDRKPRGICGSGLIAVAAELLDSGLLAPNGRYQEEPGTPRVRRNEDGYLEYVLAWAAETETGTDVVLTEADLDNLIRTKAAIFAGCRVLLRSVGLEFEDVDRVIIAGGFGQALDLEKSVAIGLLPPVSPDRFLFVGNGALLGARAVSFSRTMHARAESVARRMTHVELADNSTFMDEYVAAQFLPHTDAAIFQSGPPRQANQVSA